jgi:serine/threonine-protein kinase
MSAPDTPSSDEGSTPDLLKVIGRSGVLTDRQYRAVRAHVEGGKYPSNPSALAGRLVQEGILTEFQADRLLRHKSHGLVIDRYVILDRLGEGAMGRVFKAQHRLMGRIVALKFVTPKCAPRIGSVQRFRRELRLIGRLDHPHLIRGYDANQIGSGFYLVMEYVGGQTLDRVLEARGPLPPDEVVDYAAQVALGLAHAHAAGIVHRDVKPSNLLRTDDGQIKVLDLGLGTLIDTEEQTSYATAAGRAVGTIDFMSPEQASGAAVDGRSDGFGLGCTMYVLLTGRLPFPGDAPLERLVRRLKGPPIPITDLRPDLPPAVVQALEKLLARRPEDRFQSAAEAAEALRSLLPGAPPGTPGGPPGPTPPVPAVPAPDAPLEPSSDSADWLPGPARADSDADARSSDHAAGRSLIDLAGHSPGTVLAMYLAGLLAALAVGFLLGRS